MKSCFGYETKLKPYIHILASLTIWAFVVALLTQEQANTVMLHLDQVHTYALQKIPMNYDGVGGARATILNSFNTQWLLPTDDAPGTGCFWLSNWAGNTACQTKRQTLVTDTRKAMGCDLYKSPACSCTNQVLKLIASDMTGNSFSGTFSTSGKNISGQQATILSALDACHFMHHPSYVATETLSSGSASVSNVNTNSWVRRVGLLFMLSTMVTGNAVLFFLFPSQHPTSGYSALWRILAILVWPVVSIAAVAAIEGSAINLVLYIVLPPFFLLIWYVPYLPCIFNRCLIHVYCRYEYFLMSPHRAQFLHPFFFDVVLATLAVISLVENSVLDYDNIVGEIWKAHMIACLYFGVSWFTSKAQLHEKNSSDFGNRAQQESVLVSTGLAVLAAITTAIAPYTSVCYTNFLLWMPLALVLVGFIDLLWITEAEHGGSTDKVPSRESAYYVSGLVLVIMAFVTVYYWRDYSSIYHIIWENTPTRSVQYNYTNPFLAYW